MGAAVDEEIRPGDPAGVVGGQDDNGLGDVGGLPLRSIAKLRWNAGVRYYVRATELTRLP